MSQSLLKAVRRIAIDEIHIGAKAKEHNLCPGVKLVDSPLEAVEGAEVLILATEWKEFACVPLDEVKKRMHTPLVFDGRNFFDPKTMSELGFTYRAIGRPVLAPKQ